MWISFTFLFEKTTLIHFYFIFYFSMYFDAQMTKFHGFTDGANRPTQNLASTTWVIYSPSDELIISAGLCLAPATNNVAEYQAATGLMAEALSSRISQLIIHLDSQLIVLQINVIFSILYPTLLHLFQRVCLLESSFTYI